MSDCCTKNLNLVEAEVGEVDNVIDADDDEALELEIDEEEILNCIV